MTMLAPAPHLGSWPPPCSPRRARRPPSTGRIGAEGGYFEMTNASKSAKAIFDGKLGRRHHRRLRPFGLGQSFFVAAHGRYFQKTGERVFVADPGGEVFRLGHPLTIRLVPVYAMVGYRFLPRARTCRPTWPSGGGATSYEETSDVAGLVETPELDQGLGPPRPRRRLS